MKMETKEKLEELQDWTADLMLEPDNVKNPDPARLKLIADAEQVLVNSAKAETERLNAETKNLEAQTSLKKAEVDVKKADAALRDAKTKAGNAIVDRIVSFGQLAVNIGIAGLAGFTVLNDLPTGKFADMVIRPIGNLGKTLPKLFK